MTDDVTNMRTRMVAGAADMISRRGLTATSVRDLATHTRTPLGSTYHYFPGGKYDLAAEAVRWTDDLVADILRAELDAGPQAALRAFLLVWRKSLLRNDFRAGCPVLAVSIENIPNSHDSSRSAASAAFENWTVLLAGSLRSHGASKADAKSVATLIVAAVEGAVAICRAQRKIDALDQITRALDRLVSAVI